MQHSLKMTNDIAAELALLHTLKGSAYVSKLKAIAARKEFHPLPDNPAILTVGGQDDPDYPNLIRAARKAVEHGFQVYILPNPHGGRTADFIFVRRNVYKLFDLKTISGRNIVEAQLMSSVGQANRALLNLTVDYNPSSLARSIKRYFERNDAALEVLIFKGKKTISVTRDLTLSHDFYRIFMKRYVK